MLTFQIGATFLAMTSSARERARAEITAEIVAEARHQLGEHGAAGLSLRAVARELGMVSSAVYRYFASRDELLTALIIDSYDALGEVAEAAAAASARRSPRNRWVEVAAAVRSWAVSHPNEYSLLYGTPVPGYQAPDETSTSGTRVSLALLGVVRDAAAAGKLRPPRPIDVPRLVAEDLERLRDRIDFPVADDVAVATLLAWTQLFGLLSFELFSQTRGVVTDHEAFFVTAATAMAEAIGL